MKYYIYIILILLGNPIQAVGEAGAIFLLIPTSPISNGMGRNGVSNISENNYGVHDNPANKYFPKHGKSINSFYTHAPWLSNLAPDIFIDHYATHIGFSVNKKFKLSLGIERFSLDLGQQSGMDEQGNPILPIHVYMFSDATNIAIQYNEKIVSIPIKFNLGITRKHVLQDFGSSQNEEIIGNWWEQDNLISEFYISEDILYDYGILFESTILNSNLNNPNNNLKLKLINGYSISNLGDYISFGVDYQSDPTPRCVRMGLGLQFIINAKNEKLLSWNVTNSVQDLLIRTNIENGQSVHYYQRGLGDIKILEHIIFNFPSSQVEVSNGHEINYKNKIAFRFGNYIDIDGKVEHSSYGLSFSALKLIDRFLIKRGLNNLIDINFHLAYYKADPGHPVANTLFYSSSFAIKNIDKIINKIID